NRPTFPRISHSGTFPTTPPHQSLRSSPWGRFRRHCRISHSGTFPPERPNQSRRISAEFCTSDVSAETAESIPLKFHRISHSGTFLTKPPNFR
ncbi:MAG: hypothetical protein Q8881_03515, partial [Sweet potato little leaf phytoplasma]|nr:hypothetical protein [Sweet potato little leaf phytoplasma]